MSRVDLRGGVGVGESGVMVGLGRGVGMVGWVGLGLGMWVGLMP